MGTGTNTGPSSAPQGAELQPSAGMALGHQPITFMLLHDTHLSANKEPSLLQVGAWEQYLGSRCAPSLLWGNASPSCLSEAAGGARGARCCRKGFAKIEKDF